MSDEPIQNPKSKIQNAPTRREFLRTGAHGAALVGVGALAVSAHVAARERTVWQIDPYKCIQCERCAANCVLTPSAVKCVRAYEICGYCELCTAFFEPDPNGLNAGAENQLCPTGAIVRTFVEDPYYEYSINEPLCIGCSKCVKGCTAFGNGSMYLQVRHDRCLNCNECSIAAACPSNAYVRVPASLPYLVKGKGGVATPSAGVEKERT
ncbi:MAG: ferredoxin [Planctomycetota bacterium]|nr:ferredoxin [Planctomycetota bacterium]